MRIWNVPATIEYETPDAMNMFIPDIIPYFVIISSRNIIVIAPIASWRTTMPNSDGFDNGTKPVSYVYNGLYYCYAHCCQLLYCLVSRLLHRVLHVELEKAGA